MATPMPAKTQNTARRRMIFDLGGIPLREFIKSELDLLLGCFRAGLPASHSEVLEITSLSPLRE
jgi:hypothetical protein